VNRRAPLGIRPAEIENQKTTALRAMGRRANAQRSGGKAKGAIGNRIEPLLKAVEHALPFGKVYERIVNYRLFIATYRGFCLDELPRK
jgi:hypothetical protein